MSSNRRKVYVEDATDGEATPCPNCGCRHREEIARFDDGRTLRVTQMCRNCGRQFVVLE